MKPETTQNPPAYLRLSAVKARYQIAGSTVWKWAADPTTGFPRPLSLGKNVSAWKLADLLAWEASRHQVAR